MTTNWFKALKSHLQGGKRITTRPCKPGTHHHRLRPCKPGTEHRLSQISHKIDEDLDEEMLLDLLYILQEQVYGPGPWGNIWSSVSVPTPRSSLLQQARFWCRQATTTKSFMQQNLTINTTDLNVDVAVCLASLWNWHPPQTSTYLLLYLSVMQNA